VTDHRPAESGPARLTDGGTTPAEADGVVGDLLARDRRSPDPALHAVGRDRTYSYFDLCNTAAKAGNVLRHVGVRPGDVVAVEPRRDPETALTALGAWLIGARVTPQVATATDGDAVADHSPRALVVHTAAETAVTAPPGTSLVVFGGDPTTDGATHWETEVWSENPAAPPAPTTPDDPADGDGTTHRRLLDLTTAARERGGLDARTAVVAAGDPASVRARAAGLLAPLAVGGVGVCLDSVTPPAPDEPAGPENPPVVDEDRVTAAVDAAHGVDGVERVVVAGDCDTTAVDGQISLGALPEP
jgi:Acyl-CoA synthetases (AMP-forming)/AMP-acid ligases II